MSRPSSAGENLESILASIRRSLAEQSTGLLDEEADASSYDPAGEPELLPLQESGEEPYFPAPESPPPVPAAESPPPERAPPLTPPPSSFGALRPPYAPIPATPAPAAPAPIPVAAAPVSQAPLPHAPVPAAPAPLVSPAAAAPMPSPAAVPLPQPSGAAAPAPKDPLWFLSREGETADKGAARPAALDPSPATGTRVQAAAEAKPAVRTDIVRGPLPPFFGSSPEPAKIEPVPVPGGGFSVSVASAMPPSPAATSVPLPSDALLDRVKVQPAANPEPPLPVAPGPGPAGGVPPEGHAKLNGKTAPLFGPAAPDGRGAAADGGAQIRGLEAMVAELLRPMLRRWLDENMPRLVSAALKAEAELISKRDPHKP